MSIASPKQSIVRTLNLGIRLSALNGLLGGMLLLLMAISSTIAEANDFRALDQDKDSSVLVNKFHPVFDFDSDSCLPSAAISREGKQNGGLKPSGSITGKCRKHDFVEFSNTYHRSIKMGHFEAHMYELYFLKDQWVPGAAVKWSHRHDVESVIIYFDSDKPMENSPSHIAVSAHGGFTLKKWEDVEKQGTHPKVVYHKDGVRTHAFRFAKRKEAAENPTKHWVAPPIVSWTKMHGDGVNNSMMRKKMNEYSYGKASFKFIDSSFLKTVNKSDALPSGYPKF